jgi:predicted nucleic-acid-binding protein
MTDVLDTNIIIRYLTNDHPDQSPRAYRTFLQLAGGTAVASLSEAVLVESVQVLSSRALYNLPRASIRRHLSNIIRFRGVRLARKKRYLRALEIYAAIPAVSFVDALLVTYAESSPPPTVLSFDQGFDRVPSVTRREP